MANKIWCAMGLGLVICLVHPLSDSRGQAPEVATGAAFGSDPAVTSWSPQLPVQGGVVGPTVPSHVPTMVPAGPSLAAVGDMIGFSRELAGGSQAITLINASRRWMAVYHVDQAGQIRLVSSRPLDADFSFQFNATAPLPEDIRRLQGG